MTFPDLNVKNLVIAFIVAFAIVWFFVKYLDGDKK